MVIRHAPLCVLTMRASLQGGAKASEAAVIYQELGERHNWTVPLYNGAAACAMQLGNWEEAEQYLQADGSTKDFHCRKTDCLSSLYC